MDLLVIVIPQAFIAGAAAVTAVDDAVGAAKHPLEGGPVCRNKAPHMTCAACNRVVQDHRVEQQTIFKRAEETALDIRAFNAHFTGKPFQQCVQHRTHDVEIACRLIQEGHAGNVRFEIVGQGVFFPDPVLVRAGITPRRFMPGLDLDGVGIAAGLANLKPSLTDDDQRVVLRRGNPNTAAVDIEFLLQKEVPLGISDVVVVRLIVMLRPVHRNGFVPFLHICAEAKPRLQRFSPARSGNRLLARYAGSGLDQRLFGKVGLATAGALAIRADLPGQIRILARRFADIAAGIKLAVCHDLGTGGIVRDCHLQIPRQLQILFLAGAVGVGQQLDRVHRKAVFGKYVVSHQEADQALAPGIVLGGTAEIPQGAAPAARFLVIFHFAGLDKAFLQFFDCSAEIVHGQLQCPVLSAKMIHPRPVVNTQAMLHVLRDGVLQQLFQAFRPSGQIVFQPFIAALVEEHGLVIPIVLLVVLLEKGADGHSIDMTIENLFILDFEDRRADFSGDHTFRRVIIGEIMGGELGVGHDKGSGAMAAARSAGALYIVGRAWRHVAEINRLQAADVYAHFKGGRAAQGVDLLVDKRLLIARLLVFGQLCRMFLDIQRVHLLAHIQTGIMIVLCVGNRLKGLQFAIALDAGAAAINRVRRDPSALFTAIKAHRVCSTQKHVKIARVEHKALTLGREDVFPVIAQQFVCRILCDAKGAYQACDARIGEVLAVAALSAAPAADGALLTVFGGLDFDQFFLIGREEDVFPLRVRKLVFLSGIERAAENGVLRQLLQQRGGI